MWLHDPNFPHQFRSKGLLVSFLFINVNHEVGYESSESIPISLGYILAAVKAAGHDGVILDDLLDRPLSLRHLEVWIRRTNPAVVGFTTYRSTIERIRFLCRYLKSRHPEIPVVLGGPQALFMPPEGLDALPDVDALVRGEAEVVIPAMADGLEAGRSLDEVLGITCRSRGRVIDTGPAPQPPEDLDKYPSPYLDGILNLQGKDTAILLSSRGCRHVCRFCITPRICKGKIRYHSVERTLAEMELLAEQGIGRFWFADPNFTENRERTLRLLGEKVRRGIGIPFWCQTRADLIDREVIDALKESGADTLAFGLESGSPGVLAGTRKAIELGQLEEHIRLAHSVGIQTELFSIFGLPEETVDDAVQTLRFVQSLDIPIESNSGSQQMQLYFGSAYEKHPERFGFRPLEEYRPAYLSVGDRFETAAMTRDDLKKVRHIWTLANAQMERDVYYKQHTVDVLDFLLTNRDDLANDPAYHAYGALAAAAIEEYELLEYFLRGYDALDTENGSEVGELLDGISFFQETEGPVQPTDRVIFDSRSRLDGVPFLGISGKYWDVLLGVGQLLPAFEQGFAGARQGEEVRFTFTFPDDYDHEELSGREIEVEAKIHKIFRALHVADLDELHRIRIVNRYDLPDLELLEQQNDILYYLALRDTPPEKLAKTPSHFLGYLGRLAKLHKEQPIARLVEPLHGQPKALSAVADALAAFGKYSLSLQYLEMLEARDPHTIVRKARCLLGLGEASQALHLLEALGDMPDLTYQEVMLETLKVLNRETDRIPALEHRVLDLKVGRALEREALASGTAGPVVHGAD
ncbi:MAG: radical SAM protein [Thermodesulfobacteriota bacterium]